MSELYLIRHAESEANAGRIFASQLPYPLTAAGREESQAIAAELKALAALDRIYTSDVLRAVQTAEPFGAAYGLPLIADHRLAEQHLGAFSGLSYDIIGKDPTYQDDALKRWDWVPRGGGESYSMMAARLRPFFAELEALPATERVLVVTHAVCFRIIRGLLENTLPAYPKHFPNNGEIWRVSFVRLGQVHAIESLFLANSRNYTHNA